MKKNYIAPSMTVIEMESTNALLAGSTLGVDYDTTIDNGDALVPSLGEDFLSFGENLSSAFDE